MRFIPDLVGPFVEMALIDHDGEEQVNVCTGRTNELTGFYTQKSEGARYHHL